MEIEKIIDDLCLIDNVMVDYSQGRRRGLTDEETEDRALKAVSLAIDKLEKTKTGNRKVRFEDLWDRVSDALYDTRKTIEIAEAFNSTITGLRFLGSESKYIFEVLNTTTYAQEEYEKLISDIGVDMVDMANKMELMRSVLFGDCFGWHNLLNELKKYLEEGVRGHA